MPKADALSAPARAVGLGPRAGGDEPRAHRGRLSAAGGAAARGAAGHRAVRPISSSAFPARRDADFEATLALVERGRLRRRPTRSNTAPRPGTPAAEMRCQVPEAVKAERLQRLQALLDASSRRFNARCVGRVIECCSTARAGIPASSSAARPSCRRCMSTRRQLHRPASCRSMYSSAAIRMPRRAPDQPACAGNLSDHR